MGRLGGSWELCKENLLFKTCSIEGNLCSWTACNLIGHYPFQCTSNESTLFCYWPGRLSDYLYWKNPNKKCFSPLTWSDWFAVLSNQVPLPKTVLMLWLPTRPHCSNASTNESIKNIPQNRHVCVEEENQHPMNKKHWLCLYINQATSTLLR